MRLLQAAGLSIVRVSEAMQTALHVASRMEKHAVVAKLRRDGINVDGAEELVQTATHRTHCAARRYAVVAVVVTHGADVTATDAAR